MSPFILVGILAAAAVISAVLTWLFLKAAKLLFKAAVFLVIFAAVSFLLIHFLG